MRTLVLLSLAVLGAIVGAVVAASLVVGFRAHPELWLPWVVIAAAFVGAGGLVRRLAVASREALAP